MNCDIVIPVYNQLDYTRSCIESIKENTDYPHRVIVVDDGGDSQTAKWLDRLSSVKEIILLRNEKNLGWLGSVNRGIGFSKAEYVCVMNNDTLVYPGWLSEMVRVTEKDSQIGMVNPVWELPKSFHGGRDAYFRAVVRRQNGKFIETDWARGYCFLIKRAVIDKIGGLDEKFSPGYYDDWDFSLRAIQAGFIIVRAQGAFVWHYKNVTYGRVFGKKGLDGQLKQKKQLFESRWGKFKKVLLVADNSIAERTGDLEKASLYLLRQQTRLTVIKGKQAFPVRHTNCLILEIPEFLLKLKVLACLLRNAWGKADKRFDYVICSENMKLFLNKLKFITGKLALKKIADLP